MPDLAMLRIIGRGAAPVFFFLVAFSNSKKMDCSLITLGLSITIIDFILFGKLAPNILITLFILRYFNSILSNKDLRFSLSDSIAIAFLMFITFPTLHIFEYSSLAVMPYLLGHITRINHPQKNFFMIFLGALYFLALNLLSNITIEPLFLFSYIVTIFIIMGRIEPQSYPKDKALVDYIVYFLGKYALQIYFVHLALFKIIEFYIS